jgi:hypothetical protein
MRHPHGAFEVHVQEAIVLNRRRLWRYAHQSRGRSLPVSLALIASELLILPIARSFDRRAQTWSDAGIPLFDDLFTSMSEAPPLHASVDIELGASYLSRHLLESAERVDRYTPLLCERATTAGLPSPRPLLESLLQLHRRGARFARMIDRLAHFAHRRGVPILANDLPAIRYSFGVGDSYAPSRPVD